MKLYSTNNKNYIVSFKEAVLEGMAPDGGLFMPLSLPKFTPKFLSGLVGLGFTELSFQIAKELFADEINSGEIPINKLEEIVYTSLNFDAPLVEINDNLSILELFHGPTLAFKDFGARFLAAMISYFQEKNLGKKERRIILVATSGDTGSAVANAFHNAPGIEVILLYPSGKVSRIQEQQLTTLGGNITALEVDGTFDDCQRMVKEAFASTAKSSGNHSDNYQSKICLSSANSINIARLLPQSFYYFYAYTQLIARNELFDIYKYPNAKSIIFSVPSGNFGNLTAGLFAKEMGLPVEKFIAAVNSNDVFPQYLRRGFYEHKPSVLTISNAMDVGNPSNFARIEALYGNAENIGKIIYSQSYSDNQTIEAIREVYTQTGYLIDPHGAVGYLALKDYHNRKFIPDKSKQNSCHSIILETAYPAKFANTVKLASSVDVKIPERLAKYLELNKKSSKISSQKEFSLTLNRLLT